MKKWKLIFLFCFCIKSLFANDVSLVSRFQLDSTGKNAESRVRVDYVNNWQNNSFYNDLFEIKAFASFMPVEYICVAAGNSFFKKYPVKSGWLCASDDYLKTGRLLKGGVGFLGTMPLGQAGKIKISVSGLPDSWNDNDEKNENENPFEKVDFNSGIEFQPGKKFSAGAVFNKINTSGFQYGIYTGFCGSEDLLPSFFLNAGFIYNFRDLYMDKCRYAGMVSLGYEMQEINLGFYGDFISGFGMEYLTKSGHVRTYENGMIPFYTAGRISWEPIKKFEINIKGKCSGFYNDENINFGIGLCAEYKISKKYGAVELEIEYFKNQTEILTSWKIKC